VQPNDYYYNAMKAANNIVGYFMKDVDMIKSVKVILTIGIYVLILWGDESLLVAEAASKSQKQTGDTLKTWPSQPPANCPFKNSPSISGIAFTGRYTHYTRADTWYPSWASDGDMYSPYTDGSVR